MRPRTLESQTLVDAALHIRKDRLLYTNSHEEDYFVITSTKQSVAIVAVSPTGQLLVTQEYRHAVGKVVTGFTGGLVDEGETPLEAAKRELAEESGCTATSFEVIGSCSPLPGILDQTMTIVLAKNACYTHEARLQPSETIHTTFISPQELANQIKSGIDADGVMCTALYFYSLH